jgi:hypothetical protein
MPLRAGCRAVCRAGGRPRGEGCASHGGTWPAQPSFTGTPGRHGGDRPGVPCLRCAGDAGLARQAVGLDDGPVGEQCSGVIEDHHPVA